MSSAQKREFTFVWEIWNFNFCTLAKDKYLFSPNCIAENLDNTSWYLKLHPRGEQDGLAGCMACYLCRSENDRGPAEIECEFEIQVISSEEKILQSDKTTHVFTKKDNWGWYNFWNDSIRSSNTREVLKLRCNIKEISQKNHLFFDCLCKTKINVDECCFTWIVKNLNSDCSELIKFPCGGTSQIEISVEVLEDDVEISILRVEGTKALSVMCQITLLDLEGVKYDSKQALHFFENGALSFDVWEFPNFLKKSKLNFEKEKYLEDDCFALQFEIAISNEKQSILVENQKYDSSVLDIWHPDISILEDFKRLYKDKIHADVNLVVGNQTILAHKNILSIRSPVFLAMFDADMVEKEKGSVTISDLEAETVNSLLEYMYTGTVLHIDYKVATKLIIAANKYQVLSLQEKCAHFLKFILSHANVCEVLVVADMVQHEYLKVGSINYIKDNWECIFLSEEWDGIARKNLKLATDTFIHVSKLLVADRKKPEKN